VFAIISDKKLMIALAIILTFMMSAAGVVTPLLVRHTINDSILHKNMASLIQMAEIIVVVLMVQTILMYYQTFLTNSLGQEAIRRLRTRVFDHVTKFRITVFDRTPVGTMITRTISDVETVADVFAQGFISIAGDLLQIIFILAAMFYLDWQLTLVSIAVFPFLLVAAYIFKEAVKKSFQEVRTQVARLNAFINEHITGMQIVQVFSRQEEEMSRFKDINAEHRNANIRSINAYSIFFPVIEVFSAIAIALIVWWAAREVIAGADFTLKFGDAIFFISCINLLFRPVRQIADRFNTLQMGMVAAGRIFNVLDSVDEIPDKGEIKDREIEGRVEFRNVWFAYEGENWILKNVSFTVEPGQTLAIVGHTGAGKTSVTNLVNRLYPYQKGEICIDGKRVEDYKLGWLRKQIAVVLQDVFLFSDTIANNIRLYNDTISREEMIEAARMVAADRFIEKLPNGYDYEVQERGATLSTGQRQLISFIRAIIQDPKILILDEATSSIDHETEELIQHATSVLLKGRTSIVIAHRLATIQNADKILVMDKGIIAEEGTHQELLAKGGLYRKLYELQFAELVI
jgi:ATP-binding cassette subfamily B protein